MLHAARLLEVVLPESAGLAPDELWSPDSQADTPWRRTLHILSRLVQPTFAVALAVLLREMGSDEDGKHDLPRRVFERWKLATDELEGVNLLLAHESLIRQASRVPWPRLQRVLVAPRIDELLNYAQAVTEVVDGTTAEVGHCRQKLMLPESELNPPQLITGEDLKQLGIPPGAVYRPILEAVRDAQLEKQITTRTEALALASNTHRDLLGPG
jgi:hypothetical protein